MGSQGFIFANKYHSRFHNSTEGTKEGKEESKDTREKKTSQLNHKFQLHHEHLATHQVQGKRVYHLKSSSQPST